MPHALTSLTFVARPAGKMGLHPVAVQNMQRKRIGQATNNGEGVGRATTVEDGAEHLNANRPPPTIQA